MNNFEKAIFDWLYPCPHFKDLFLSAGNIVNVELDGQTIISPEIMGVDDVYLQRFVRKSGKKRYTINVSQFNTLVKVSNSSENTTILDITKSVQEWILEQIANKNYPQLTHQILEISTTGISLASVDENGGAKVQFQILIDYFFK